MTEAGPTATGGTADGTGALRPALREFLLGALPATLRSRLDAAAADATVDAALTVVAHRHPGELIVSVTEGPPLLAPSIDGTTCTVLEVAMDDRPLLFSTVLAAVDRCGATVDRAAHPILGIDRRDGRVVAVRAPRGDGHDESFIRVELDELLDGPAHQRLHNEVVGGVEDLLLVETAGPAITEALDTTAVRLESGADDPEWAEAAAFCRWLRRRHFLVTGALLPDGTTIGVGAGADSASPMPQGAAVLVRRSRGSSRVHRSERAAVITFADPAGGPPTQFVGLTTMQGRAERPSGVAWVRHKLAEVLRWLSVVPFSHTETQVRTLFDDLPWDVLLVADATWIAEMVGAMLAAVDDGTTVLRLLPEPSPRAVTAAVAVPEIDYRPTLDDELAHAFQYLLPVQAVEAGSELGEGGLVTLSVTALLETDVPDDETLGSMATQLRHVARSWPEQVTAALVDRLDGPGDRAAAAEFVWQRWADRLPATYRDATPPTVAADDLLELDGLSGSGGMHVRLVPVDQAPSADAVAQKDHDGATRPVQELRLVIDGPPPALSDLVPALESHGLLTLAETTYVLDGHGGGSATVLGLLVQRPDGPILHDDDGRLTGSLVATLQRSVDADSLNSLVVSTGMDHEQVAVLRAYARYLPQLDPTVHPVSVVEALAANPATALALWSHLEVRFGPSGQHDAADDPDGRERVVACCDAVARLDHDRLLRSLLALVDATVRTNVWASERNRPVVLKLDGTRLAGIGNRPAWREVWVSSPEVEGVHLRAGAIARGGLRWSDRPDDVRTEVLQLADAQRLKNALIVPTGAKGGFVVRRPPADGAALRNAVEAAYRTFVDALLDVTDNRVDGATVRPQGVRAADGDDAYLVVAADRGTASFSDIANGIAAEHGFWLGDAFASGGSAGYDHKELGVTARGAWVSVTEHFARRGVDVQTDRLRVAGIGDMSGDVFGNGLLRSRSVQLVAAFDHRHVLIDPDPDPARSFEERQRLFDLPRSSWDDVDRSTLSPGAMVHPRSLKQARLTPEVRALLGTDAETLTTPELVRAVLTLDVDLLYLGGIGTFVRATTEADGDVGDPANRETRVTAPEIRAAVVGEGANLGITPRARVELALCGVELNADAIDNSAGVDTSDHEVNLKILLGLAEADGRIDRAGRDRLLAEAADDVVATVLRHVRDQNRSLTRAEAASRADLDAHLEVLGALARSGRIDRRTNAMPGEEELARRRAAGLGLVRPELAVLMAAEKVRLTEAVLASSLPDGPVLDPLADDYVPTTIRSVTLDLVQQHPLRREIVTTRLANEVVDRMGITWVTAVCRRTGSDEATVLGTYLSARTALDLDEQWVRVDAAAPGDRDEMWDRVAAQFDEAVEDSLPA
jgi:glutamate dehydrogenase